MPIPNLHLLNLNGQTSKRSTTERWLNACGANRPNFKSWKSLSSNDKKRLMHAVAAEADEDGENGSYVTPYSQIDIDDVLERRIWSVEHVVPRSFELGNGSASFKNDPNGWTTATQSANSRRSNYPLMLWQNPKAGQMALPNTLVIIEGEIHYVPPIEQRARLARKWMYTRCSYSGQLKPPSLAQKKYASHIVALAKAYPIQPAEKKVNAIYQEMFGWSNPLLKPNPEEWYDSAEWRNTVFR